ncbi:carbon-nitrogen hydrolase family protein [Luteimonas sp. e5]
MKIAAAKYPVTAPRDFTAFAEKQAALLAEARAAGAELALLPEYLALELAAGFEPATRADLHASLAALQPLHGEWMRLYSGLAQELGMDIVAGTFLLDVGGGRYRNRSYLFAATGGHLWQDKLRLTGFEKQAGVIESGDALKVFGLGDVRAGIAVCYDSEFPLPVRAQCEAGARLLLVPSCTDTAAGATRVRVGCLARALENRCFVAQAVTTGEAPWSPALDSNTGEAALIAPMDVGLPHDGLLAETAGAAHWAIAELDFAALEASRAQAQVANDRDWAAQYFPSIVRARLDAPESEPCRAVA